MEGEKYLKTNEVAKILGVNRKTIQRWAENGILVPAHKTGAGYSLYTRQQITDLCKSATNLAKEWRPDALSQRSLGISGKVYENLKI